MSGTRVDVLFHSLNALIPFDGYSSCSTSLHSITYHPKTLNALENMKSSVVQAQGKLQHLVSNAHGTQGTSQKECRVGNR